MTLPTLDSTETSPHEELSVMDDSQARMPEVFAVTTDLTTVTFVCEELRKLHVTCCGMPHEDRLRNPGRGTCANVTASYNLACVHSYAGVPVMQAYEMACRLGMCAVAHRLWSTFEHCQQQLDLTDSEGSVLYSISTGLVSLDSDRAESAVRRLHHVDINTDVAAQGNKAVQAEIRCVQASLGRQMLAVRDAFLSLLEPLKSSAVSAAASGQQPLAPLLDGGWQNGADARRDVPVLAGAIA